MDNHLSNNLRCTAIVLSFLFGNIAACGDAERDSNQDMALDRQESANQERLMEGKKNKKASQENVFEATLSGNNQSPSVDTRASGNATVILQGDSIHIEGEFSGLSSNYTASHIHKGAKGENGKPVITLEAAVSNNSITGAWDGAHKITEAQIKALKGDSLYINVHTADHKSGEIRGQLRSMDM